jgi:hypothetical protein
MIMTANGPKTGLGTGAVLDVNVGSFTSLQSLFSQVPTIYGSPQSGMPASWWANQGAATQTNQYVAYTRPTTTSQAAWFNVVPGGAGQEANCLLQGVNVCEFVRVYYRGIFQPPRVTCESWVNCNYCRQHVQDGWCSVSGQLGISRARRHPRDHACCTVSLGVSAKPVSSKVTALEWHAVCQSQRPISFPLRIIYNNENDCISIDASFGIGGWCPRGTNPQTTSSCYSAGQFAACCCLLSNCYSVPGYFSVWINANTPPSCLPGYYCPTPYGRTPVSRPCCPCSRVNVRLPLVQYLLPAFFSLLQYTSQFMCPPGYYCPALSTTYTECVIVPPTPLLPFSDMHTAQHPLFRPLQQALRRWLLGHGHADFADLLWAMPGGE